MIQILYSIASIFVLVVLFAVFMFLYLKGLYRDLIGYWDNVLVKLNARLDKLPVLLTIIGANGADKGVVSDIAKHRAEALSISEPTDIRMKNELLVSKMIKAVVSSVYTDTALKRNVIALEYANDFKNSSQDINKILLKYNTKVVHYNKYANSVIIKPLLRISKLPTLSKFIFEI